MSSRPTVNIDVSSIVRSNKDVKDEVSRVKSKIQDLEHRIEELNQTTESVQKEIEFQTKLQKELELVDAEANLIEAKEMEKIERTALQSAEEKLAQSKADIVRDFVKGIRDQITQFKNLIANELDRLQSIISGRDKVERLLQAVDPLKDDRELIAETRKIYNSRQELVVSPINDISNQVGKFVQDRHDLKHQIENLNINDTNYENLRDNMDIGDIFVLQVPVYIAGFASQPLNKDMGQAGENPEYYRVYSSLKRDASGSPSASTVPDQLRDFNQFISNLENVIDDRNVKGLLQEEDLMNYDLDEEFSELLTIENDKFIRKAIQDHYYMGEM